MDLAHMVIEAYKEPDQSNLLAFMPHLSPEDRKLVVTELIHCGDRDAERKAHFYCLCIPTKGNKQCGILREMRPPIFIRPFTEDEQRQVQAGLRASDAFILRRCQILSASARGERVPSIARQVGCDDQVVRNVIHGFNAAGLDVLRRGSSRPHRLRTALTEEELPRFKDLLHRSPREFGKERGTWTLELVAQVCFEQGLVAVPISDETVRRALKRLKTNWKRAKHWITSPDRQYRQKKRPRQADRLGQPAAGLGHWFPG